MHQDKWSWRKCMYQGSAKKFKILSKFDADIIILEKMNESSDKNLISIDYRQSKVTNSRNYILLSSW